MTDEKKLQSNSNEIPGSITNATVRLNGKNYNVRTVKDANGNIVSVIETPKIFGIF